jgi:hypothetical protein
MKETMSFDDVVEASIKDGHLSGDEIEDMKNTLAEMRRLANANSGDGKIIKLSYKFDGLAATGCRSWQLSTGFTQMIMWHLKKINV